MSSAEENSGPWQAQVCMPSEEWVSCGNDAGPYCYATAEEAASVLRRFYPDQHLMDRLDRTTEYVRVLNTETGETSPAWRHA